jgi:hypothetical protein
MIAERGASMLVQRESCDRNGRYGERVTAKVFNAVR